MDIDVALYSGRTRDYHDLYQVLEYLERFIWPVLLYNKVIVTVFKVKIAKMPEGNTSFNQ